MTNFTKSLKKLGINIGVSILSILLLFVFTEIVFRLFYPQDTGLYVKSPTLGLKMKPNYRGAIHDWWYKTINVRINSIGLRDREYGDKKNNSFRIIALGDSQTFGLGVEAEETYSKVLEELLNDKASGKHFEVINTGVSSYGTSQEFQYLKDSGIDLKPDLLLVGFFPGNDFANNLSFSERTPKQANYNMFEVWLSSKSQAYYFLKKRYTTLRIMNSLKNKKNVNRSDSVKVDGNIIHFPSQLTFCQKNYTPKMMSSVELTKNKILELVRYAESKKLQLMFIIIPSKDQVYQSFLESDIKKYKMNPENIDVSKINNIISDFFRENGIKYIDLLPSMKQIEEKQMLYYGEGHLNKEGHKFIAKKIYQALNSYELMP